LALKKLPSIYPHQEAKEAAEAREAALIARQLGYISDKQIVEELPLLPKDRMQWELHCRPYIKGKKNRLPFLPMIREAILDPHPYKQYLWGRQWGKTTSLASDLAFAASTINDYDQTYFNIKLDNLQLFQPIAV